MKPNEQKFIDLIIHRNRSEGIPSPLYIYRKLYQISKKSVILLFTEIEVKVFQVLCMYIENEMKSAKIQ